jgi:hypothetical protein
VSSSLSGRLSLWMLSLEASSPLIIQNVPGGKVSILGGHSIGHSNQKHCMYICPIPNGFRDRPISLYSTLYRRATRLAKCIDVDGGIFGNVLY